MGQLQKGWYAYSRNTRRRKKKTEKNFWNNKWLRILSINANPQIQETLRVPSKKLKKKKKKTPNQTKKTKKQRQNKKRRIQKKKKKKKKKKTLLLGI